MSQERRLGAVLVERGVLAAKDLDVALAQQRDSGRKLGEILLELGCLDESAIRWALAEQLDLPLVHPDPEALDPAAVRLLPEELCRRYAVLPMFVSGEGAEATLTLAAADPGDRAALDDLRRRVRLRFAVVASLREEIETALDHLYGPGPRSDLSIRETELAADVLAAALEDPTGSTLVRALLLLALEGGSGDGLHFLRRDGESLVFDLKGRQRFAGGDTWHTIVVDRLRQLAELPGADGRVLQRGRFLFGVAGQTAPALFRLSILRGVEGEEAQVKHIRWERAETSLGELGFSAHQTMQAREAISKPGLIWVTAPGEAGLGSTLFSLLREVPGQGKALTVEEEVFYRSASFLQIETLGLEEGARREVLRELKYLEFTRVLVDRVSPGQLPELLSLALRKRWVLAATPEASLRESLATVAARAAELPLYGLRLVVHQRLVPLLCLECREPCVLGSAEKKALARWLPPKVTLYEEGRGCDACAGSGLKGARAFFEVLPVDMAVREALYAAGQGEPALEPLLERIDPTLVKQVGAAVAAGTVSLAELWELL